MKINVDTEAIDVGDASIIDLEQDDSDIDIDYFFVNELALYATAALLVQIIHFSMIS